MINSNRLTLHIYSGNTEVLEPLLWRAQSLSFGTCYPGGLYSDLSFYVPIDITRDWIVRGVQTIRVYNGFSLCWEGDIQNIEPAQDENGQGYKVTGLGKFTNMLMQRRWRKMWADTSLDNWLGPDVTQVGSQKTNITKSDNTLMFAPQNKAWATNEQAVMRYTAPADETIKRVTLTWDFSEAGQDWKAFLWNETSSTEEATIIADATGTNVDVTFATPATSITLAWKSNANQTPTAAVFAKIYNLTVYGETGAINLTEIAKDVRAKSGYISVDFSLIGSNTYSLVPFVTDGAQTLADILSKAASYGDSNYNPWAFGLRGWHLSTDSAPILFVEQQPLLTDYDYAVRVDEATLVAPLSISLDYDSIVNYIYLRYRTANGVETFTTPSGDATFMDTASIAKYNYRELEINLPGATATTGANYVRQYLARHKDPQYRVNGNIVIKSHLRTKAGGILPASQVVSGKRIKIENYINDLSGTGLTFLITATSYDDESETVTISVGYIDPLDVQLARMDMV